MTAAAEELYSLLVPLSEDRLIVPRACVAEVVRFSKSEQQEGAHRIILENQRMRSCAAPFFPCPVQQEQFHPPR